MIDLRSDTVTRPTPAMRAAMAAAEVGDEQMREDPTVNALQERVATLLGKDASLFLPTATMANQIAVRLHARPGDVLVAERTSHVAVLEFGGPAVHGGVMILGLSGHDGRVGAEQVLALEIPDELAVDQRPTLLWLENTHNAAGGRCWPLDELDATWTAARARGLATHLDGARLLNAAVAQGVAPARLAAGFDTVSLCLSKGLGCPVGAVLAGSHRQIARAWREKHLFGGAMRQAGILAAAGLYALDHHVERLADDHSRARRLAEAWSAAGLPTDVSRVETNFVQLDFGRLPWSREEGIARVAAAGVGLSETVLPGVARAVTHLDVGDDEIERAAVIVPEALRAP